MTINELIALCGKDDSLDFLVIGGFAVVAHGHSRMTYDLDLLVRRSQRAAWVDLLRAAGFVIYREEANFVQLSVPTGTTDIDLMLVANETFAEMQKNACPISFGMIRARMVSLNHLMALKLHVLKQHQRHRGAKDMDGLIHVDSEKPIGHPLPNLRKTVPEVWQ